MCRHALGVWLVEPPDGVDRPGPGSVALVDGAARRKLGIGGADKLRRVCADGTPFDVFAASWPLGERLVEPPDGGGYLYGRPFTGWPWCASSGRRSSARAAERRSVTVAARTAASQWP